MKYRKKPIVVEAIKFDPTNIPNFVRSTRMTAGEHWTKYTIQTLEGEMEVGHGDWIITGIMGEVYPIKNNIFEATYEAVE